MLCNYVCVTQVECILVIRFQFCNARLREILNTNQVQWFQEILILKMDSNMFIANIAKKYIILWRLNWGTDWGKCIEVAREFCNIIWLFPITRCLQNPRWGFRFHLQNWDRILFVQLKTLKLVRCWNKKHSALTVHIHNCWNSPTVQSPGKSKSLVLAFIDLRIYLLKAL